MRCKERTTEYTSDGFCFQNPHCFLLILFLILFRFHVGFRGRLRVRGTVVTTSRFSETGIGHVEDVGEEASASELVQVFFVRLPESGRSEIGHKEGLAKVGHCDDHQVRQVFNQLLLVAKINEESLGDDRRGHPAYNVESHHVERRAEHLPALFACAAPSRILRVSVVSHVLRWKMLTSETDLSWLLTFLDSHQNRNDTYR